MTFCFRCSLCDFMSAFSLECEGHALQASSAAGTTTGTAWIPGATPLAPTQMARPATAARREPSSDAAHMSKVLTLVSHFVAMIIYFKPALTVSRTIRQNGRHC